MAARKTATRTRRKTAAKPKTKTPKFDRVLVVSAHPDDPEFSAGGSVAKFAMDGAEVTYVIVTDGSQGGEDPDQKDSDLAAIRQKEQRAAARVLGVKKVEFLGYKDGHLTHDLKLRRDIVRMIRKYKPDLVITHLPGRLLDAPMGGSHPDHIAVGEATFAAVYPDSRNPRAFRSLLKEGYPAFVVKELWVPYWTSGDYFVDITKTLDLKMQSLKKHKSQVAKPGAAWDFEKFMRKRHRDVGKKAGYTYAESFKRIRL
ncbi:MAG TPA: PIG-L deacetylase family protein [Candidatus Acidoferrum sp.]|nr:PIG-L deacetylase family protein [Candidatus Acidoferrum sp.]